MEVRYIKREDIDQLKWDSCVHYAQYGNIYGYTWYLDNACETWDGLVEGDYESVMPIVWNDKLPGAPQVFQPLLAQQLGIYSINVLSRKRVEAFVSAIPSHFKKIVMHLHEGHNRLAMEGYTCTPRENYVLNLNSDYEVLAAGYHKNHKRNLRKAVDAGNIVNGNIKPEALVEHYRTHQGPKVKAFKADSFHAAHRLIYNGLHRGRCFLSSVMSPTGEVLAAAAFFVSHNRITMQLPTSSPKGREENAMHLLIDMTIRTNAGRPIMLDFEGSSVPGIARFYEGFGAKSRPYLELLRNDLPFWWRWLGK